MLDVVLEQTGRRALSLLLTFLLLGGVACGQRPSVASSPPLFADVARPIVLAHRGGAGEGPESTLAVMREVLARDPEVGIELDVRRTRDGQIVVIHDGTVDRTTNGRGRVEHLTLAELQALDAGHCATPGRGAGTARRGNCRDGHWVWRGRGARIPTLAEVLAALPRRTLVGIEVKTGGFEEPLARLLRRSGRLDRVMVGSADGDVAGRLRALLPEAAHYFPRWAATRLALAAKLSGGRLARPAYQVLAVPPEGGGLSLDTPSVLATARARGVLVAYWTIDDEAEMERLLRLGADALITNYPGRARAVITRLRAAGALARSP